MERDFRSLDKSSAVPENSYGRLIGMDFKTAAATLRRVPIGVETTDELALHLRCHRHTIERLVRRGILHPIRVSRTWRFDRAQAFEALGHQCDGDSSR